MEILKQKGREFILDGKQYFLKFNLETLNKMNELSNNDIDNFVINSSNVSTILAWMINEYIDDYNKNNDDKLEPVTTEYLNKEIPNNYIGDVIRFIVCCMKGDYEEKNF